jgi:hypothetical protein
VLCRGTVFPRPAGGPAVLQDLAQVGGAPRWVHLLSGALTWLLGKSTVCSSMVWAGLLSNPPSKLAWGAKEEGAGAGWGQGAGGFPEVWKLSVAWGKSFNLPVSPSLTPPPPFLSSPLGDREK